MTAGRVETWVPPQGPNVELVAAGRWWDAVRAPSFVGVRVLARLGGDSGAVIEDGFGATFYWLVRPGAADAWELPGSYVAVQGTATYVAVPPVTRTEGPGLRWAVPLGRTRCLTDPALLHATLAAELDAMIGPR
ncbi:hypothetical protein AB0A69_10350 [Streptomyces sp. NPDC045431]|uniref:hypothetical protein n=1 Tax=Streptomyces sp. NPDC045431 TaxID=3155613 RepID=UPI0033FF3EDA